MKHYALILAAGGIALMTGSPFAAAHDTGDPARPFARPLPAAIEQTRVDIRVESNNRIIESNAIPNHPTGVFPSRGNPNSISAQDFHFRVPATPQKNKTPTPMRGQLFGVAINGIPFDPATAECYGQPRGGRPGPGECAWREEAIENGNGHLGLDQSNAHVQPNGTYHYHGIPNGLLSTLYDDQDVMVGYAADGFKIYVSRNGDYKSGYQLKDGFRPGGAPDGRYTGKYTADFEYVGGKGTLDECNGTTINDEYAYVLTDTFPFIPRCWMGTPDDSFRHGPPVGGNRGRPSRGQRPPPRF